MQNSLVERRCGLVARSFKSALDRKKSIVLLDTSGSMNRLVTQKESAIERLRKVAAQVPVGTRMIEFNSVVRDVKDPQSLTAGGHTRMELAFERAKELGCHHCILVTDGEPTDPEAALKAASGMKIDIVYIGMGGIPDFLFDLARATSGKVEENSIFLPGAIEKIASSIKGLLPGGAA